ncbi:dihydrofolate reductase [Paenibacillus albiflavus]|uniref:Dihydrofolate reductase n=1 Tax=Paenibacillus albiflavus TaxID=2545760 RepID=A0A4R4E9V6_9BACL|nr:dihydrofolate reductase [Paenibacillus albiflavus]TCZ74638.1 dihydrofolate reductase [Paenibacillus albiflavus]
MSISYIVAMDRNRVIGKDNRLPWRLPADLKFFKQTTMGHPIVMGRKTYESIGKPLPGRLNIIMTQNRDYQAAGCEIVYSVEELLKFSKQGEVFVTGGSELFRLFMPHVDRMYITEIEHEFAGDTWFPVFSKDEWQLTSSEQGIQNEENPYTYFFNVYDRIK